MFMHYKCEDLTQLANFNMTSYVWSSPLQNRHVNHPNNKCHATKHNQTPSEIMKSHCTTQ